MPALRLKSHLTADLVSPEEGTLLGESGRYALRLYDVPVELGWLERPLAESELNPIPFL